MGRISLLNDELIDKIAAGEVVERPASVVKELVENAIDAGATRVEIALELGGTRRITVTDNGSGMDADDAHLALRRHATSKLHDTDGLFKIETMGFRGEALAAIASVSRLTLATRLRGAADGLKLVCAPGEDAQARPWNGPEGTVISVEQLFYNLPARAKFLKSPATELSHIHELTQALALCHPNVGFALTHNGRDLLQAPAVAGEAAAEATLRARIRAVLGADIEEKLVFLKQANRFGVVVALISPPGVEKPTSKWVHTFVNGRPVKDRMLRFALLRGYHSHLMKGRHPIAAIYVSVDPALVDVNVHPAKTEVRFQYPGELDSLVSIAIRECLRSASWSGAAAELAATDAVPTTAVPASSSELASVPRFGAQRADVAARAAGSASRPDAPTGPIGPTVSTRSYHAGPSAHAAGLVAGEGGGLAAVHDAASIDRLLRGVTNGSEPPIASSRNADSDISPKSAVGKEVVPWEELDFVGAFDRCFLFFESAGRLLVVDQHAFHERVLYERLLRDASLLQRSQLLLVPEGIDLDAELCAKLAANQAELARRGFALSVEGPETVTIKAVPAILARADLPRLIAELANNLQDSASSQAAATAAQMASSGLLATVACHAAVRAGEELGEDERRRLIAEARDVDFYHNCPHGRRVFRWLTRETVAGWFDR